MRRIELQIGVHFFLARDCNDFWWYTAAIRNAEPVKAEDFVLLPTAEKQLDEVSQKIKYYIRKDILDWLLAHDYDKRPLFAPCKFHSGKRNFNAFLLRDKDALEFELKFK